MTTPTGLDAITQAAHDIARGRYTPDEAHPWMDDEFTAADYRNLAERVVQLAADVAATHEKIRAHAEAVRRGRYEPDPEHPFMDDAYTTSSYRRHAEAILGLVEPSEHTHEETT